MQNASSSKASVKCEHLKKLIREVPDFPKPGILFYDITTLLKDKLGFATLIAALSEHYLAKDIDLVLGMGARGFIFGPAVAYRLNAGFVPVRKPGKLPAATAKYDYALDHFRFLHIPDDASFPVFARITFGRHHNGKSRIGAPCEVELAKIAVRGRAQYG